MQGGRCICDCCQICTLESELTLLSLAKVLDCSGWRVREQEDEGHRALPSSLLASAPRSIFFQLGCCLIMCCPKHCLFSESWKSDGKENTQNWSLCSRLPGIHPENCALCIMIF